MKKFDQVWLMIDESETTVIGIDADANGLDVYEVMPHDDDTYSFGVSYWRGESLPSNGDELWEQWFNWSSTGWSTRDTRDSLIKDFGKGDECEAFLLLERWAIDCPSEFITSPICNITEHVYGVDEPKSEIFRKIAELNAEINSYIDEVESEIKDAVNKRNQILEQKHIDLYDFLKPRWLKVKEMFPNVSLQVETGLKGVTVWFKRNRFMIEFGGYNYTTVHPRYTDMVNRGDAPHKAKQYNKVLTSWDAIQENIFDQNLYEALSEKMTEQVVKARERLSKARAELAEVQ